jgi:hypothetical protein
VTLLAAADAQTGGEVSERWPSSGQIEAFCTEMLLIIDGDMAGDPGLTMRNGSALDPLPGRLQQLN